MTRLSDTTVKLLKVIRDFPGLDGEQIKHNHFADDNQTGNNLALLEKHGYINYLESGPIAANASNTRLNPGWYLTVKGTDVLKYG